MAVGAAVVEAQGELVVVAEATARSTRWGRAIRRDTRRPTCPRVVAAAREAGVAVAVVVVVVVVEGSAAVVVAGSAAVVVAG